MNISIYGAGYVGLISAVCLAKLGHQVTCADINELRIAMLLRGECPIYEEHLSELLQEQLSAGRLYFTANLSEAIKRSEVHFIATGTPSLADGNADLSQVFAVAVMVAREAENNCLLVTKSTVPVGTGDAIQARVTDELRQSNRKISIEVASNPEFLREGSAIHDFLNADRIIIGGESDALNRLKAIYQPLIEKGIPLLSMSLRSAELTKYAANAMLACRISFINQVSRLAENLGANIDEIRQGIALDPRIGPHFLQAGIGYGGSCFPKDVRALVQTAKSVEMDTSLIEAIDRVNDWQKTWVFEQLAKHFTNNLKGLKIGIWGLSFKPGTDDIREASSLVVINSLIAAGVTLHVFDPVAMPATQRLFPNELAINWCKTAEAVLTEGLDALVIATEWPEFKNFDLRSLRDKLTTAPLFDGRNCFNLAQVVAAQLAYYYSVGRPAVVTS